MKTVVWSIVSVLSLSALMFAQAPATRPSVSKQPANGPSSLTCANATLLPEDGTSGGLTDSISQGASTYYTQSFLAGHSYSVDVWDPFDPFLQPSFLLAAFDLTCSNFVNYQTTGNIAPFLYNNANRIAWIQSSTGPQVIKLSNGDPFHSYSYKIRITDTTLYNPRWSTYSGFVTQYAFVNVSANAPSITGTLTVYDSTSTSSSPVVLATASITVPSGGEYLYIVTPPTVPANHFGFSTFAFVGPPGVIRADAYFINSTATVVVPSTFGPISEPR